MKGEISHRGVVVGTNKDIIKIEILSKSGCSSCAAAGLCNAAEAVKKIVEVPRFDNRYNVGDEVDICLAESMGLKAVLISYAIPVIILLIIVVSLSVVKVEDLYAGIAGILGVGIYYLCIYLFRRKIEKDYKFYIKG